MAALPVGAPRPERAIKSEVTAQRVKIRRAMMIADVEADSDGPEVAGQGSNDLGLGQIFEM